MIPITILPDKDAEVALQLTEETLYCKLMADDALDVVVQTAAQLRGFVNPCDRPLVADKRSSILLMLNR